MALDSPCRRTPSTMPSSVHSMPGSLQDSVDERSLRVMGIAALHPSYGRAATPVVIPAKAGNQYAVASRLITSASGILGRPVKPGDDN
jgi:hypothetical protein